ncbi:MAG: DNA repair protein RecN, partial [Pontimonas sp.]|nr:DNA repair protein RecN [Pontimonas sp.]
PGLTVVTGETGAGKTMVVTALGLLLGDRADSARVRQGSSATWVEGRFTIASDSPVRARVADIGAALDDDELIVAREVLQEGRSRAVIGGRNAPVATLSDIAEHLVVIHGQSDQIRLKSESAQREALDRFAGAPLLELAGKYTAAYEKYRELEKRLHLLQTESQARAAEAASLREALGNIESVKPEPGEDVRLTETIGRLTNTEDLRAAALHAKNALASDSLAVEVRDAEGLIDEALKALERVVGVDATLEPIRQTLAEASYQVAEVSTSLAGYLAGLEGDGGLSLEASHERLASLSQLLRRYGPTLDDVLELERTGSERLLELDRDGDTVEVLSAEADAALALAHQLADELSSLRKSAAETLGGSVTTELSALAMATASFHVRVTPTDTLSVHGRDQVALLLAAHPGAEPLPLGKGASGGELSRVMLALEVVIAGSDPVPTFVFDEVDAGVGGASALEIGRRLDVLAQTSQVIVVTHLAQVAAFANNHLRVVKDTDGHVTTSSVQVLEGEERVTELARMLGGMADSQTALSHARELIEKTHSVSRR